MRAIRPRVARSHTGVVRYPIYFPGLTGILGERLLEVERIPRCTCDHEPHHDWPTVKVLLVVKLSNPIPKGSDSRCVEYTDTAVDGGQTPLTGRRVVQTERQKLQMTMFAIDVELDDVRPALPETVYRRYSFVLCPPVRTGQNAQPALDTGLERPDMRIEVVLAVRVGGPGRWNR